MRSLLVALCALFVIAAPAAQAARVTLADDPAYGCIVELTGRIETGDAAQLKRALAEAARLPRFDGVIHVSEDFPDGTPNIAVYRPMNLCLDSPGGALAEAMDLIDLVHGRLGTVIRAGAACESACALVFMAGSYATETDFGYSVNRFLHVDGRLGFHAPSLEIEDGAYDAATVARAYALSASVSAMIFGNMVRFHFAPSLAARMHATPAQEMFYISRVEEAARWGISVLGVDAPAAVTDAVIANACDNLYLSTADSGNSDPDEWGGDAGRRGAVRPDGNGFAYTGYGMEAAGTCNVSIYDKARFGNVAQDFWGEAPMIHASVWAEGEVRDAVPPVFFGFFQAYMAWPGKTLLAALPRGGQVMAVSTAGRCHVFDENGPLVEEGSCVRTRVAQADGRLVDSFLWASGATTVLENAGGLMTVNGNPGSQWYWMGAETGPPYPVCTRNDATARVFCFGEGR